MEIYFDNEVIDVKDNLSVIPLRDLVMFPGVVAPLLIGRIFSINAVEQSILSDKIVLCVTQKEMKIDNPTKQDLYKVGVVCRILQTLKLPDSSLRLIVEGLERAKIVQYQFKKDIIKAKIDIYNTEYLQDTNEIQAIMRSLIYNFKQYTELSGSFSQDIISAGNINDNQEVVDYIASRLDIAISKKQELLEKDLISRMFTMLKILGKEIEILKIKKQIDGEVKHKLNKSQREYYLNQQLKVIHKELGIDEGSSEEIKSYEKKLAKTKFTKEARKQAKEEIKRLRNVPKMSQEYSVIVNYLNWLFDLPWENSAETGEFDLKKAEDILDKDHYGLKQVKERIIEYLAVLRMVKKMKGQILCFVGPPGVGKTSLGISISKALNRKFVRMSLGGVRDEAEIRGHRRTYVGAMPGIIIQSMKRAGKKNPVIMLDEIDKMSVDFRGDPSAALLEVLDPEENNNFHDHYLEVGYDLSEVLFITTANDLYSIPITLRDRMEIIQLPGYTEFEKLKIAEKYLFHKQLKYHGIDGKFQLQISSEAMKKIIENYTMEAGVRNLERNIAKIMRKSVKQYIEDKTKTKFRITRKNLNKFLGVKKYTYTQIKRKSQVGIANGLAWTPIGGVVLKIEVVVLDGKGNLSLTGSLGDVMKESANAALSYARSNLKKYNIQKDFYKDKDLHIHVPEGAIAKDGPSAGITIATAIISALSNRKINADYTMTGEITLTGDVLKIGGLAEKLVAAKRMKIKNVIIPKENKEELKEINKEIIEGLNIIPVETMDEVLDRTLM